MGNHLSSPVCSILVQNVAATLVVEVADTAVVEEEDMGVAGEEAVVAGDMGQSTHYQAADAYCHLLLFFHRTTW